MVKLDLATVCKFGVLCALVLLCSCNKENAPDCFKTAGEVQSETRDLGSFTKLELNSNLKYELIDTNFCGIEITGPQNLLPKIDAQLSNGILKIENVNTCNFLRSYEHTITVKLYFDSLTNIQNFSTGSVVSMNELKGSKLVIENKHANGKIELNLNCDTVYCGSPAGANDSYLYGTVNIAQLYSDAYGIIHAEALDAKQVFINNSSLQPIYAKARLYAFVQIEDAGDVILHQTPNFYNYVRNGSGELIFE
ncbi:MAG: hypothetical protein RL664_122 [Bacteroidota bacterium]|jgi:hypothetical protein